MEHIEVQIAVEIPTTMVVGRAPGVLPCALVMVCAHVI